MSILSGPEIKRQVGLGRIVITPYDERQLNQVSYDVRLGSEIVEVMENDSDTQVPYQFRTPCLNPKLPTRVRGPSKEMPTGEMVLLRPGRLYLGHTVERIRTDHYVPTIDGKSSIGRLGVFIHVTAGYGEPGFDGQWTLEIVVTLPTILYPGMRIGQMRFTTLEGEVELYRGNYTGKHSTGPVPSRAWRQFEQDNENGVWQWTAEDRRKEGRTGIKPLSEQLFPGARAEAEAREQLAVEGFDSLLNRSGGVDATLVQERTAAAPLEPGEHQPPPSWRSSAERLLVLKNDGVPWRDWIRRQMVLGRLGPGALQAWHDELSKLMPYDPPTEREEYEMVKRVVTVHELVPWGPP